MTGDAFGFSDAKKVSTADKLKAFRPQSTPHPDAPLERIDAVAEAHGFVPRERVEQVARRRRDIGPTLAINMRAPERVATPFIHFCEENRFSYWEGIEELMRRAGCA